MIQAVIQSARHFPLILLTCILFTLFLGCNQRPSVTIEGGTLPVFIIADNGRVQSITVSGPDFENSRNRDAGSRYMKPYWQIMSTEQGLARIDQASSIAYGKVPDGFKQVFPANGAAPQPLVENELFTFDLRLKNGEAVAKRFVIHNGKAAVEGS
jgi:hypothetical protein